MIAMFQSDNQRKRAKDEEEEELRKIEKAKMDKPRALEILRIDSETFESYVNQDQKKELVEILSQAVITETRLLQTSNIGIHHLSRKLLIEDAYQFLLKDINSESLDSRRIDFMMMTGLALDKDEQLKQKTEEIIDAFHSNPVNRFPRDAKTKDDFVKQWLSMSDNPYNDDVFTDSTTKNSSKEGGTRKTKHKTLSTSSAEEKLSGKSGGKKSTYQAADGLKRRYSQRPTLSSAKNST